MTSGSLLVKCQLHFQIWKVEDVWSISRSARQMLTGLAMWLRPFQLIFCWQPSPVKGQTQMSLWGWGWPHLIAMLPGGPCPRQQVVGQHQSPESGALVYLFEVVILSREFQVWQEGVCISRSASCRPCLQQVRTALLVGPASASRHHHMRSWRRPSLWWNGIGLGGLESLSHAPGGPRAPLSTAVT